MKIKEIVLKDFKRFKELVITDLPKTAKLVILVGPNGCGKSSLFDGLYAYAYSQQHRLRHDDYYSRSGDLSLDNFRSNNAIVSDVAITSQNWKKAIYRRTAYRNTPSFHIDSLASVGNVLGESQPERMIDNDSTTDKNYRRLISNSLEDAYGNLPEDMTLGKFRQEMLGDIQKAVKTLFPNLILNSIGNPLAGAATFRFSKGDIKGFEFQNLSGGEKAAFDLILDLILKRKEYNDTIFCIDEPENHINPKIQRKLLRVLYELVPSNCQLWLATHSAGMMREAETISRSNAGEVIFLDFDRNFDEPVRMKPVKMSRALWQKIHSIALDDLAKLVAPENVVVCESNPTKQFDADCYNKIFGDEYPNFLFVSAGGKTELDEAAILLRATLKNINILTLQDRDGMTNEGRLKSIQRGKLVLSRTKIEDYLIDDEVLLKFATEKGYDPQELIEAKNADNGDSKRQAALVYQKARKPGATIGDNRDEFLSNTLAPLIKPGMQIYEELERDIFEHYKPGD